MKIRQLPCYDIICGQATPSSPKVAFHVQMMELLAVLQLECQISTKSFVEALRKQSFFNILLKSYDKDIYRCLVGDCLIEYMYHQSTLNTRHSLCNRTIGRDCPVCQDNPSLVSMDANFELVHKVNSGRSEGLEARHKDLFFKYDQQFRDLADNCNIVPKSLECSNFQAGNLLRSKSKNVKLDISGVFGSICKHDIPLYFLNMTKGESLAYSAFITAKLLGNRVDNEKLTVTYDIACSLDKYMKNRNPELLINCHLAVPVFHSFAHNLSCQLTHGQTYVESTGLTDGENIERFWSYLRQFKKITKEMTLNHRQDLLNEALIAYTENIILKIGNKIKAKLEKAENVYEEKSAELKELLASRNQDNNIIMTWYNTLKTQCVKSRSKTGEGDPDKIIQKLHGLAVERQHLCIMMKKYADGQNVWKRICRSLSKNTNLIKKHILKLQFSTDKIIEFKGVCDLRSSLYSVEPIADDQKKSY